MKLTPQFIERIKASLHDDVIERLSDDGLFERETHTLDVEELAQLSEACENALQAYIDFSDPLEYFYIRRDGNEYARIGIVGIDRVFCFYDFETSPTGPFPTIEDARDAATATFSSQRITDAELDPRQYGVVVFEEERFNQDSWSDFICIDDTVDGFATVSAVKLVQTIEYHDLYELLLIAEKTVSVDGIAINEAIERCGEEIDLCVSTADVIDNLQGLGQAVQAAMHSYLDGACD
jgi:hypothetical protein